MLIHAITDRCALSSVESPLWGNGHRHGPSSRTPRLHAVCERRRRADRRRCSRRAGGARARRARGIARRSEAGTAGGIRRARRASPSPPRAPCLHHSGGSVGALDGSQRLGAPSSQVTKLLRPWHGLRHTADGDGRSRGAGDVRAGEGRARCTRPGRASPTWPGWLRPVSSTR